MVFERVNGFLEKVNYIRENPMYKSGEEMSLEDAMWNLTAGFNYENSMPDEIYDGFYVDSSFTYLDITDGMVNLDDLVSTYIQIDTYADAVLGDAPFDEKENKFTFIDVKSNNGQTVELVSTTIVGQKGIDPGPDYPPYEEGNDWRYGDKLGTCNNGNIQYDAADTLRDLINSRRYLHVTGPAIYTNPVTLYNIRADYGIDQFDNPDDEYEADNERDYLMFKVHENNLEAGETLWGDYSCIEHDDMNFYYYGTSEVIYEKIPNMQMDFPQAFGKTFMYLDTLIGVELEDNWEQKYYIHIIKQIRYAKRYVIEG
ncbi:MAG: hypothetical protein DRJ05_06560 [Bacteroidetes bacterium]|nr:MAG: hypothetical protein DRJ05_06560 [Bacteroidota bacterium]